MRVFAWQVNFVSMMIDNNRVARMGLRKALDAMHAEGLHNPLLAATPPYF